MATKGDEEDISRAAQWGYKALQQHPGSIGIDKIGVGSGALSELRGSLREQGFDPDMAFGVVFGGAPTSILKTLKRLLLRTSKPNSTGHYARQCGKGKWRSPRWVNTKMR